MSVSFTYARGFKGRMCDVEMENGNIHRGTITTVRLSHLVLEKWATGKKIVLRLSDIARSGIQLV